MPQATIAGAAAFAASLWLSAAAAAETVAPQAVVCTPIRNVAELQAIQNDLNGSYCLKNDIDASSVANFVPIGGFFGGRLFGNGWVIRNLTIDSSALYVGLFGAMNGALIQDVGLVNVNISGTAANAYVGGLVGRTTGTENEIRRVHVTGRVAAAGDSSTVGGITGFAIGVTLADSWSSAAVDGAGFYAGGAVGEAEVGSMTSRVYATGPVTCGQFCSAGGLIGRVESATVVLSYASGPIIAGDFSDAGGLIGEAVNTRIERCHALGAVRTGAGSGYGAGGLIGYVGSGSTVTYTYAVGRVSGGLDATLGGLVGISDIIGAGTSYWDLNTSGQAASAAGVGYATAALRATLPPGFDDAWAITANRSYPFLNEADIDFAAPLATLVSRRRVFTFLPIGQRDKSQYAANPTNANAASLAAVYTMIARAIGITSNVAKLKDVKIDKYFWNDATETASWAGPVTTRATIGDLTAIPGNAPLSLANVFGEMRNGKLVVLRGVYSKNGVPTNHWMLGTLYTQEPGGAPGFVMAHDPWTGMQVMIDKITKKVVSPADHPLRNFRINGYQPVTLN